MRYLMIEAGRVVNAVEWDGSLETWQPPEGIEMLRSEPSEKDVIGQIGDTWDGATFTPADPIAPALDPAEAKIATLTKALIDKGVLAKSDLPADIAVAVEAVEVVSG